MAGLNFTFSVPGNAGAQIVRTLTSVGERASDLRAPFGAIADDFNRVSELQFASSGARGEPAGWAPLSAAYAARKKRAGFGTKTLVRTGRMLSALTGQSRGDSVRQIERDSMRVGVRDEAVPYAKYHQSGTRDMLGFRARVDGKSGMPIRAPIQLTEKDRQRWMRGIARHVVPSRVFESLTGEGANMRAAALRAGVFQGYFEF